MTDQERIDRLADRIRSFKIEVAGGGEVRGGFGEIPDNGVTLDHLQKAFNEFRLEGNKGIQAFGSIEHGYNLFGNPTEEASGGFPGGIVPPTPTDCPGPNAPSNYSVTASGMTTASGSINCGSSTAWSESGTLTWVPDSFGLCRIPIFNFPSTDYHCTSPTCDCTIPPGSVGSIDSFLGFTLEWNADIANSYCIFLSGQMREQFSVPCGCAGTANGTLVQFNGNAPFDLTTNPLGTYMFNFDDGVSFFSFTITLS